MGRSSTGPWSVGRFVGQSVSQGTAGRHCDVLVVGAGPSGASCAHWLAEAGHDVVLVERKRFPREKTCGDALTPRAIKQLDDMGLSETLGAHHRYDGLRSMAFGRSLEMRWPVHPSYPSYGYVVTRKDLDQIVAERAQKSGALLKQGTEATLPVVEDGACRGAMVTDTHSGKTHQIDARYVVVADGANSRFGRALGASRNRAYPQGMAIRGYYRSPRSDEPWIEAHLDVRDHQGRVVPGYGWIFPLGDGRVNVGIGLLSTFSRWKEVNTSVLMDAFVERAPRSWDLNAASSCGAPTGGRLPMGLSVSPRYGLTHLVVGDASGVINPFNGEGIAYAYETGRMAATVLDQALHSGGSSALRAYEDRLQESYGLYFRVARAFMRIIGRPEIMRALVGMSIHSRPLMEWVMRIMANLLRPDELGPAEAAYAAVAALARVVPSRI